MLQVSNKLGCIYVDRVLATSFVGQHPELGSHDLLINFFTAKAIHLYPDSFLGFFQLHLSNIHNLIEKKLKYKELLNQF